MIKLLVKGGLFFSFFTGTLLLLGFTSSSSILLSFLAWLMFTLSPSGQQVALTIGTVLFLMLLIDQVATAWLSIDIKQIVKLSLG